MIDFIFQPTHLLLAGIIFATGLSMLIVLGAQHRQAVELHNRIAAGHDMRRAYLESHSPPEPTNADATSSIRKG